MIIRMLAFDGEAKSAGGANNTVSSTMPGTRFNYTVR
jgi:hypothetical protein